MANLTPAHAHNALAASTQMYGATLADMQAEIDNLKANRDLKQQIVEAYAAQIKEMEERIKLGIEENKKLLESDRAWNTRFVDLQNKHRFEVHALEKQHLEIAEKWRVERKLLIEEMDERLKTLTPESRLSEAERIMMDDTRGE